MFYHENKAKENGFEFIVGIDEAGRGPLAGPVVAAAVLLKTQEFQNKIRDSKKLSASQREKAFVEIRNNAYVGVGILNEGIVDSLNILRASHQAMSIAVSQLIEKLPKTETLRKDFEQKVFLLIDGNSFDSDLPYAYQPIVGGDSLSCSIAAASIIAKVTRDRILNIYDRIFPQYGFKKHKGYPTQAHRLAIQQFGLSRIHRKTFKHL
ncbi:MAG: ribonuclease HII [Candidatus Omnitrophota bacterium]